MKPPTDEKIARRLAAQHLKANLNAAPIPSGLSSTARHLYMEVVTKMQEADELGGVDDTKEYIAFMKGIANEAQTRAHNAAG